MKKFVLLIALFSALLSLSACSKMPPLSGTVKFETDDGWRRTVYLVDPVSWKNVGGEYVGTLIDSAQVDADGFFAFEQMPPAPKPRMFQLAIQREGERFLNRLINASPQESNYFPLVWQDESAPLDIRAQAAQFQASFAIVQANAANKAMLELRDQRVAAYGKYLQKEPEKEESHDLLATEDAALAYLNSLMDFAAETPQLLAALTAIRWASMEADFERSPELLAQQAERWKAVAPNHPWVLELAAAGNRANLPILIGDEIANFDLPMQSGDTLKLHDLLGERLTLLDLWASWCGPCRVQNREYLAPLWEKYQSDGFQIVGYGLEASKKAWASAIEADGAHRWPHASHLQGDDSILFESLRLTTIPANLLLDAQGRVVARNLHSEELVEFVDTYLK